MERMKRMKTQATVVETIQDFCHAWFEERDADKALAFFHEDVSFVGTGEGEAARGKAEMERYLREDIREIPEPFSVELSMIQSQRITEQVENLSFRMILKNSLYAWHLRGFFTLVYIFGCWRIQSLHFAEPSVSQKGKEHYPKTLVMQNVVHQRQELLNDSLAGGMMGGYMEEGFPFYFVNRQMLY